MRSDAEDDLADEKPPGGDPRDLGEHLEVGDTNTLFKHADASIVMPNASDPQRGTILIRYRCTVNTCDPSRTDLIYVDFCTL